MNGIRLFFAQFRNTVAIGLGRQQLFHFLAGFQQLAQVAFFSASSSTYSVFSALMVGSFLMQTQQNSFTALWIVISIPYSEEISWSTRPYNR